MREKVDPYLRPIYDALYDLMDARIVERGLQTGEIEIAPLAFMRGRTLANAVVILDEAQNTTSMQMKMFLTRLGENCRMIVTGDPSQIDLPPGQTSGLVEAVAPARRRRGHRPRRVHRGRRGPPRTRRAASSRPTTRAGRAQAREPANERRRDPSAAPLIDVVVESAAVGTAPGSAKPLCDARSCDGRDRGRREHRGRRARGAADR